MRAWTRGAGCGPSLGHPPQAAGAVVRRSASKATKGQTARGGRSSLQLMTARHPLTPSVMVSATHPNSDGGDVRPKELSSALEAARKNLAEGTSPGAGLSAEESADAAYADLINTSLGEGQELSAEEVQQLSQASSMEAAATERKGRGLLGDVAQLFGALKGGAHIVRRKDGSI